MTLYRTVFTLVFVLASTFALAADPNSTPRSSADVSSLSGSAAVNAERINAEQFVRLFAETELVNPDMSADETTKIFRYRGPILLTPGAWNEVSCLTLCAHTR